MPIWTFVDYVEPNGHNPFAEWLARDVPADAKTAINNRFLLMAGSRRWPDKWVSDYEGYSGVFEARIPWNRRAIPPALYVRNQHPLADGSAE